MIQVTNSGSGPVRDVVLVYHGSIPSSLAPDAVIAVDSQIPFKRLYERTNAGGILGLSEAIAVIHDRIGDFEVGRIFLVGFSEGSQAVRAHLRDGQIPFAVVVVDGTHTSSSPAEMASQLQPWADFVQRAKNGEVLFIASHSSIDPILYESTTKTLRRITGFPLDQVGDVPDCVRSQEGNVIVYSCSGSTAPDHVNQAKYMLPKLFSEAYTGQASTGSVTPIPGGSGGGGAGTASSGSVLQLQKDLTALGFDPGPIDGKPGPSTTNAVIEFQKSVDLEPDGIVGPATRAALNQALAARGGAPGGSAVPILLVLGAGVLGWWLWGRA